MSAGEIDGVRQVKARIRERPVKIEHDQIDEPLHIDRLKLNSALKSTRIQQVIALHPAVDVSMLG
jgi:hypothetical protein